MAACVRILKANLGKASGVALLMRELLSRQQVWFATATHNESLLMNIETAIEPRLWDAVRVSISARKFSAAVLDAIHLLTDVIRERSGQDGDGVALVGAAFGGDSPKLKVTRLQTETERNVQRGVEAMLRGLYQAIRNPRSHESHQDTERDANALLLFVDYLLRVVDKSGSPFSLPALVARVLDPDFVPTDRYATLLAAEIPAKKRLATCREVFARHAEVDPEKVKFFFAAVLAQMSEEETEELCSMVSQELRTTTDEDTIRFVLCAFPSAIWQKIDEIARLRIESKLIASVEEGKWSVHRNRFAGGGFGAWICKILHVITLKDQLWHVIFNKLDSANVDEQEYAFRFFAGSLEECFDVPPSELVYIVKQGINAGSQRFKRLADSWKWDGGFEERNPDHPWRAPFIESIAAYVEKFESSEATGSEGDNIPF